MAGKARPREAPARHAAAEAKARKLRDATEAAIAAPIAQSATAVRAAGAVATTESTARANEPSARQQAPTTKRPRPSSTSREPRQPRARSLGRRAWRMTLLLALALSLAAVAALGVDQVLRWSLRTPTAGDEAAAVCAYLRSGDYTALAGEMDPRPDGASTGAFDGAAFAAGLRSLDAGEGRVTTCALRQMGPEEGQQTVLFAVTLTRTDLSYPLGSLVVVRREPDGRWRLSRASTFYYALG